MFQKKVSWKPKKLLRYSIVDPRLPWAPYWMLLDIENFLSELRAELLPRLQKWFSKYPSENLFLQYSWTCLQDCCGGNRRRKFPLDCAKNFLSKSWQHITTVSFVSVFFVLRRKPENASKCVWFLPKHIWANFKSLWQCLLTKRWSSYQYMYDGSANLATVVFYCPGKNQFCKTNTRATFAFGLKEQTW